MNNLEQIPNNDNVEKSILAKSNAVFNAIYNEQGKLRLNTTHVNDKLTKSVREIIKKHRLEDDPGKQEEISQKILKNALERIAKDFGGNLRMKKDLEDEYIEILFNEAKEYGAANYGEIIEIINKIDEKEILDGIKKGELMDRLVEEMLH